MLKVPLPARLLARHQNKNASQPGFMDMLDQIISRHRDAEGPLLLILHDVQKAFGHVSEDAIRTIASELNLTRAEVHGVVSFYHDFRLKADARPVVKLCRAEACQARGVEALVSDAESVAGARVKLEPVYCLGLCSAGPAAMVGDKVHARLNADSLKALIEATR